jgi:hypothetical protein
MEGRKMSGVVGSMAFSGVLALLFGRRQER